jgi:hypothetical protein
VPRADFVQSIYTFTVLLYIIASNLAGHHPGTVHLSFSYFTVLCYWGLSFYFLAAAVHTFTYARRGGTPLLNRFPRPLQALHYLFWTTITTYPFLVTIVYWGVLYGGFVNRFEVWSNVSQHALNSSFALFELLLTRINPAPWVHLLWLVIILACYCGLAYLTHYTKGVYVYSFLNPEPKHEVNGVNVGGVGKGEVVGYVFGIAVGICLLFCLTKGIASLRKWLTETKLQKNGKFYAGRDMRIGEVELETTRMWEK